MSSAPGSAPPRRVPACPADHPDHPVVAGLLAGDEAAFRALYGRHHAAMLRLAGAFVGDQPTAEEVVQETWLAVLRTAHKFEGRGGATLKTWIFRVLTNQGKKRGIKDRREVPFTAMTGDESPEATDPDWFLPDGHWKSTPRRWEHDTPERLAESEETRRYVLGQLEQLPVKEGTVVRLRDVEELTAEEVCEVLEITPGYQRVLLHRGRSKLRRAIDRYLARAERGAG